MLVSIIIDWNDKLLSFGGLTYVQVPKKGTKKSINQQIIVHTVADTVVLEPSFKNRQKTSKETFGTFKYKALLLSLL